METILSPKAKRHCQWYELSFFKQIVELLKSCFVLFKKNFFLIASVLPIFNAYSQEITSNYYGIFTDNPNIHVRLPIDDVRGHVYVWDGTLSGLITEPLEGEGCLAFRSTGVGWWGFGIHDDSAVSLTHFKNGYLIFSAKTSAKDEFSVHVFGANKTEAKIIFAQNGGPQNFKRDGAWHRIAFSVAELVSQGLDLTSVSIPFAAIGGTISNIAFDDIFYSFDIKGHANPVAFPQPTPVDSTNVKMQKIKLNFSYMGGMVQIHSVVPISKIIVNDIPGKTILRANVNQPTYLLNVTNWPKGLYFVLAYANNNQYEVYKLLVE